MHVLLARSCVPSTKRLKNTDLESVMAHRVSREELERLILAAEIGEIKWAGTAAIALLYLQHAHNTPSAPRPHAPGAIARVTGNTATLLSVVALPLISLDQGVSKRVLRSGSGAPVVKGPSYLAHVTLYVQGKTGDLSPSGWSTKISGPFKFSPGVRLIQGWTIGVLSMRIGERAYIYVPSPLGYGDKEQGSKGSGWYLPPNANLVFDLEILSQV